MTLNEFHAALQNFATAENVDDITALCRMHARQLGFDSFVYALRVPKHFSESRLVFIQGYPDEWIERYFAHEYYAHDPVMAHCARHVVPVRWHEVPAPNASLSEQVMNEAGDFGLRDGVTMPVHTPTGESGILSFAVNRPPAAAKEITRHAQLYVQLLSGYLHEAVKRVSGLTEEIDAPPLTEREKECLRWVADGKTSWEISLLMRTSERTVNFHLNNAMQKLDTRNRQHAVAKATLQGLIHPKPF